MLQISHDCFLQHPRKFNHNVTRLSITYENETASSLISNFGHDVPVPPPLALQPPLGVVFYSPLVGFSLLAYEVS